MYLDRSLTLFVIIDLWLVLVALFFGLEVTLIIHAEYLMGNSRSLSILYIIIWTLVDGLALLAFLFVFFGALYNVPLPWQSLRTRLSWLRILLVVSMAKVLLTLALLNWTPEGLLPGISFGHRPPSEYLPVIALAICIPLLYWLTTLIDRKRT